MLQKADKNDFQYDQKTTFGTDKATFGTEKTTFSTDLKVNINRENKIKTTFSTMRYKNDLQYGLRFTESNISSKKNKKERKNEIKTTFGTVLYGVQRYKKGEVVF